MRTYSTVMRCKMCEFYKQTKWHRVKILWWLERKIIIYKHLRSSHNLGIVQSLLAALTKRI